jgi:glyoxylase-like metal-dependent hydrolase (beta-lactamase superfamily II)
MANWQYRKGLQEIGNGVYAYLQPDGSWGWNNAGLVTDGGESLLVDTLFDVAHTRAMLDEMRRATTAADDIGTVINTHANGDHCWGNQLVAGADIIASKAAAAEIADMPPQMLAQMMKAAPEMGALGAYVLRIFGDFDFEGIELTPPNTTFEGNLTREVGGKRVELIEVGPAHTKGDILVHLPGERTVFTGDILFIGGQPIIWAGPVGNWIGACERIMAMDVETVVPGHGPITDKSGVAEVKRYLEYLNAEARARFDDGMDEEEAARDIAMGDFPSLGEGERVVVNVASLYREYRGGDGGADVPGLFASMATLAAEMGLYGLGDAA